ncbi:C-GCAxxG-C-C family (seleno)protein [Desulforhopalus sp. 52FAK]
MDHFVKTRVRTYFGDQDLNCATTAILIISEYFDISVDKQVVDAAIGMHGAGGYRAQCGIVEGTLMSVGVIGRARNIPEDSIIDLCKELAHSFEKAFSSLSCSNLRPGGFNADDPPHLCEDLTVRGISHNIKQIASWLETYS